MSATLKVENLTKSYGNKLVVNDLSFSATAGVIAFLGPNGAGKSTTMRMISGFLPPDKGEIYVGGYDIAEQTVAAKRILGYLPEGAPSYETMTPYEFIRFVAEARGISGNACQHAVADTIAKLNLNEVSMQRIDTLSKGYKRRVSLAAAIVHDPKVLILDEPTDGLDPNQKREIRSIINAMAADKTIILSTHILEEVSACCDRVIVLNNGSIVLDSTPDELVSYSPDKTAINVLDEVFANLGDGEAKVLEHA